MQVLMLVVGKMKRGPTQELVAEYLKRTRWEVVVKELPDAPNSLPPAARRTREGEAIVSALAPDAVLIALDSRGKQLSSPAFAEVFRTAQAQGKRQVALVIGGQDGLDDAVLARAQLRLAFGEATWPHQLVRVMLAEQLYRAYTILIGHPYHTGH